MHATPLFAHLAALCLAAAPASTEKPSPRTLFDRTVRGSVRVAPAKDGKPGNSYGSGFVIDAERRWVITAYHVLSDGACLVTFPKFENGRVVSDPKAYDTSKGVPGKVIDSDPRADVCLVQLDRLPEGVQVLSLAAESPRPGDTLYLVGNPSASSGFWSFTTGRTRGTVRKKGRLSGTQPIDYHAIEAQMDVNPGDSGGPLVNEVGGVVGIASGIPTNAAVRGFSWHVGLEELAGLYKDAAALTDDTKRAPADAYERRAERLLRKNKREGALADLGRAINADPKRASAYLLRCRLNFVLGRKDDAVNDGYDAVELAPNDGRSHLQRGNAHYLRGDHRRAIIDYTEAIRLMPEETVIYLNRARSYAARGKHDPALKDLAAVIAKAPANAEAYAVRGDIHHARKDYKGAIADYQAGLKTVPTSAGLLSRLGQSSLDAGLHAQAADAYDRAIKSGPPAPGPAWRGLALARVALKQHEQAVAAFDKALEHSPSDAALWFGRGAEREAAGDVDQAQPDYAKAVALGHAAAKALPTFATRHVRVHNKTQEALKIYVIYEGRDKDGKWKAFPATGENVWEIRPGEPLYLLLGGKPIEARACRIWAVGTKTGRRWDNLEKRQMVLASGPYRATKQDAHTHKFE